MMALHTLHYQTARNHKDITERASNHGHIEALLMPRIRELRHKGLQSDSEYWDAN